jgi:hypothetical protein
MVNSKTAAGFNRVRRFFYVKIVGSNKLVAVYLTVYLKNRIINPFKNMVCRACCGRARTTSEFKAIQRSFKTRKLSGLAGFLLSRD